MELNSPEQPQRAREREDARATRYRWNDINKSGTNFSRRTDRRIDRGRCVGGGKNGVENFDAVGRCQRMSLRECNLFIG